MTDKRFKLYEHKDNDYILDNPNEHLDFIELLGDALAGKEIVKLLNELHEENQTFREALKELKEIGDYQAMRIRELSDMNSLIEDEIDKKIAVLTDAKIKSFQNENEELLAKIKFAIQVLGELKDAILE